MSDNANGAGFGAGQHEPMQDNPQTEQQQAQTIPSSVVHPVSIPDNLPPITQHAAPTVGVAIGETQTVEQFIVDQGTPGENTAMTIAVPSESEQTGNDHAQPEVAAPATEQPAELTGDLVEVETNEVLDLQFEQTDNYIDRITLSVSLNSATESQIKNILASVPITGDHKLIPEAGPPVQWARFRVIGGVAPVLVLELHPIQFLAESRWLSCVDPEKAILYTAQEALELLHAQAQRVHLFVPPIVRHAVETAATVNVESFTIRAATELPYRNGRVAQHLNRAVSALAHPIVVDAGTGSILRAQQFASWKSEPIKSDTGAVVSFSRYANTKLYGFLDFVAPDNPADAEERLDVEITLFSTFLAQRAGIKVEDLSLGAVCTDELLTDPDERAALITESIAETGLIEACGFPNVFTWEAEKKGPFSVITKEQISTIDRAKAQSIIEKLKRARTIFSGWSNSISVSPVPPHVAESIRSSYGINLAFPPVFYAAIASYYISNQHQADDLVAALTLNSVDALPRPKSFPCCAGRAITFGALLGTLGPAPELPAFEAAAETEIEAAEQAMMEASVAAMSASAAVAIVPSVFPVAPVQQNQTSEPQEDDTVWLD